jgi:uncharacterized membrane-anchored protein
MTMKRLTILLALMAAFILPAPIHAAAVPTAPAAETDEARIRRISAQLHPVTGDVRIAQANAVLHLGEGYYFLPANEAQLVLTEGWGNPARLAEGVLGMVFPAGKTFADDTWGAVITYEASGYVSDSDAASVDYDETLVTLRGDEEAINAQRAGEGFPATHLVGWAQQPVYDARTHSVVWATNIQFAGQNDNSLNYDVRLLGRRGVLSLNVVTVMSKLAETRVAAQRFASAVEFTAGERYADYQPGTDRLAEYGIAGLITAGLGAAVVKKAGLLALILAFGKKIIIFLIAGVALLWKRIRRLFGARDDEEEAGIYEEAPAAPFAGAEPAPEPAAPAQPESPPAPG